MKTATVTDLKNRLSRYLRFIARGETVTVLDRGKPIAQLNPVPASDDSLRVLVAQGLARPPLCKIPPSFWRRPLPRSRASVLAALRQEREDGRL